MNAYILSLLSFVNIIFKVSQNPNWRGPWLFNFIILFKNEARSSEVWMSVKTKTGVLNGFGSTKKITDFQSKIYFAKAQSITCFCSVHGSGTVVKIVLWNFISEAKFTNIRVASLNEVILQSKYSTEIDNDPFFGNAPNGFLL